ncbi:MAG: TRAP transporter substrate-binding protein DctP [Treponema sp.]|jgi:TRAP-type C4-dicarboxylate transport system substrate-binding protein|nr:TRAP transporter substrate-binding protein DctP [Treponema sp.]
MKKLAIVLCVLLIAGAPIFAQNKGKKVTIKLASLVPEGTDWGRALNRMAKEWSDATDGQVQLIVYHNGSQGSNEADVLRKLKGNQIQAAVFTSIGMALISPEIMTLSTPFLIRNDQELNMVLSAVKPDLEARIQRGGYISLAWAKSGWIRIFSKAPILVPDDLKKQKLGTSNDTPAMNQAFKAMGYQLVPVDFNSVIPSLQSGMIDAVYQSPAAAAGYQLFGVAKNMISFNVAPFMGGIVMNRTAWRSIPDQYKSKILNICKQIEKEISNAIDQIEASAITIMSNNGLVINNATPSQEQLWFADVEQATPGLLEDGVFNKSLYLKIKGLLRR